MTWRPYAYKFLWLLCMLYHPPFLSCYKCAIIMYIDKITLFLIYAVQKRKHVIVRTVTLQFLPLLILCIHNSRFRQKKISDSLPTILLTKATPNMSLTAEELALETWTVKMRRKFKENPFVPLGEPAQRPYQDTPYPHIYLYILFA